MKAFNKLISRKITKNKSRYISILLIVLLGVAFYSGVRATSPNMQLAANDYFIKQNLMDVEIRSAIGFTDEDFLTLKDIPEVKDVDAIYSSEVTVDLIKQKLTIQLLSLGDQINVPLLIEGTLPQTEHDCVVDVEFLEQSNYKIGDTVTFTSDLPLSYKLKQSEFKIVGVIQLPHYISLDRGVSLTQGGEIDSFIVIQKEAFVLPKYTTVYVTLDNPNDFSRFSTEYEEYIKSVKQNFNNSNWYIFDLSSNAGYISYKSDSERIAAIGKVFPIVFFLVATLVSLTSMTRLVENDRTEIGTLKSLGFSRQSIFKEYLTYAISASLFGSILGVLIGFQIFPRVIFNAYGIIYNLPPLHVKWVPLHAIVATLIAVLLVTLTTYFVCVSSFKATPAILMRPKSPAPGKRIFLERIQLIWKRLNFNQKVTYRNLFRYKKRFFMTIFGIMGCTALLVTGFGLKDSIGDIVPKQFEKIRTYDLEVSLKENLSRTDLNTIHETLTHNQVNDVFYVYQSPIELEGHETKNINLVVPNSLEGLDSFITFKTRKEQSTLQLNDHEVILTEKLASLINVEVNSEITLITKNNEHLTVTVGGIVENYVYHYVYMTNELYEELTQTTLTPNHVLVKYQGDEEHLSKTLIKEPQVKGVMFVSSIKDYFSDMIGALDIVVLILIISAELLAFIVLFSLTNINIDERKRELATIKVLGFYNGEVSSYIYRENMIITLIGSLLGLVFGYYLEQFVIITAEVDMVMFSREIKSQSFIFSMLLTFVFALVVNMVMFFRLKNINMIESLKNVE